MGIRSRTGHSETAGQPPTALAAAEERARLAKTALRPLAERPAQSAQLEATVGSCGDSRHCLQLWRQS
eukprot:353423-Chlamydomonas_euryale.AAC.1